MPPSGGSCGGADGRGCVGKDPQERGGSLCPSTTREREGGSRERAGFRLWEGGSEKHAWSDVLSEVLGICALTAPSWSRRAQECGSLETLRF